MGQAMELQVMDFEKRIAQSERNRLKTEYEAAVAEATVHEEKYEAQAEIMRAKSKEEEFIAQYQEAVAKVCNTIDIVADPGAAAAQAAQQMQAALSGHSLPGAGTPVPPTGPHGGDDEEDFDGGTGSSMLGAALGTAGLPTEGGAAGAQEPHNAP